MTSESRERSWSDGQPVALFRFTRGNVSWFYTSGDRPEIHNGDTYEPAPIWRGPIRQGSERAKLSVKVTLPSTLPVAGNWRPYPPSDPIMLTVFVRHAGETDALAQWIGRVVAPVFDGATLTLTGEPSTTSSRSGGTRRCWQRGCGHVLYSLGGGLCNLNPEIVPVPASLTEVDGTVLTGSGFAAAPRSLVGGLLTWLDDEEELQERNIVAHAGPSITLDSGSEDLVVDAVVEAHTRPLYVTATLSAVSGLTLTAPAFGALPSRRLAGGFIKWQRGDGLVEFRSIKEHSGANITLDYGGLDLAVGLQVLAYPGCAHTWSDCGNHNNQGNYGGDLWMPVKSPFDGNPVW